MIEKYLLFENKLITFKEFFLSEDIKPKEVNYGIDLQNKEWLDLPDNFKLTFFKSNNEFYAVIYRDGFIGFATNYTDDETTVINNINSIKNYKDFLTKYHFNRKPIPNAMRVFNNVFYVITEGIKKFNPDNILFDGDDVLLNEFYKKMIKNTNFINTIQELGFEYKGRLFNDGRNFFTFIRKK